MVDKRSNNVLESYRAAIAAHFGEGMAAKFEATARTHAAASDDPDEHAAQVLLAAMLEPEWEGAADALTLAGVELQLDQASTSLKPHEAHAHPLLGRWTQDTFALAMADAIRAGRLLTTLAPGAPVFDHFHLYHAPAGQVFAHSQLSFETSQGWAVARFNYGHSVPLGFASAKIATGTVAFLIGDHIREAGGISIPTDDSSIDPEPAHTSEVLASVFSRSVLH